MRSAVSLGAGISIRSIATCLAPILLISAGVRAADHNISKLLVDAERGSIRDEVELGAAYLTGRGVPQDEKRAAYWYEKAANSGEPGAQKQIGEFFQAGIGVSRDPARAVRWYQRAVAGGLVSAKVNLGIAFLTGDGVSRDSAQAEDLFRQAFSQSNGLAACYLGDMYFHGMGVERDEASGKRWYEAGAKLHDPSAEFQLALILWHQQKNADGEKRAVQLLRQSADTGFVIAKQELGVALIKRPELAVSPREVPTLLEESSEAGEWKSSAALGQLSRDGIGMPVNFRTAYFHYRVAALQGGEETRQVIADDLGALSLKLGPEQTAAIDSEATSWFQNHHVRLQFTYRNSANSSELILYKREKPEKADQNRHPTSVVLLPADIEEPNRGPSAY
jgi:TPR repeat protein